jgi:hypothetical protein
MAKLPGWLQQIGRGEARQLEDGRWVVDMVIHVRRWHPGYWWEVVKAVWQRIKAGV